VSRYIIERRRIVDGPNAPFVRWRSISYTVHGEAARFIEDETKTDNAYEWRTYWPELCDFLRKTLIVPHEIERLTDKAIDWHEATYPKEDWHEIPSDIAQALAHLGVDNNEDTGVISLPAEPSKALLPGWVRLVIADPSEHEKRVLEHGSIRSTEAAVELLRPRLERETVVTLTVVCLDRQCHVIAMTEIARGGVADTAIGVVDAFRLAVSVGAVGVIFAVNHPSLVEDISPEDAATIDAVSAAAEILGLHFLDFIVIGGSRYASAVDEGLIPSAWNEG